MIKSGFCSLTTGWLNGGKSNYRGQFDPDLSFLYNQTNVFTYKIFLTFAFNSTEDFISSLNAQHAEWTLNIILKTFNNTFTGWKSMLQRFGIYFV